MTIRVDGDDVLVRTICAECFIRVQHSGQDDWRYVMLSLLSTHESWDERGLKRRIERSLDALRGKPGQWFEMMTREEVDDLIAALTHARDAAFPPPPQTDHQRPANWRMVLRQIPQTVSEVIGRIGRWPRRRQTSRSSR